MVEGDEKFGVGAFLDDYRKSIDVLKQEVYSALTKCCEYVKISKNVDDFFIEISTGIDELKSFSSHNRKIENLKKARKDCRTEFYHYVPYTLDTGNIFDPFSDKIDEIITCARNYSVKIKESLDYWFSRIEACSFGEEENCVKNAIEFQYCVLNLFDWLFPDELERIDLKDIQDGTLRRDGGYKTLPEFTAQERCGFPFKQGFIECKNYKKPSYKDLMQVFAYTLSCQESKVFQIPLSILISRENPSVDSLTWKMRGIIFNRRIEEETRLILFIDQKDLGEMVKYRKEDGDPALVIKGKIEELANWNIKRGGY